MGMAYGASRRETTGCVIAGGGPAGVMLGFLLARAGVEVTVLEKHADFFRDFRGDTVHPSTLEVIWELGLLESFLARPHQELSKLGGQFGDVEVVLADFSRLPTHCKFIVLMPQWDFLDFLAQEARRLPNFRLLMSATAQDLIEDGGRVVGVRVQTPDGSVEIVAPLTVAADGRDSALRDRAGLKRRAFGVPIDVLWLRLPKYSDDPGQSLGRVGAGRFLVTLDRSDYWQCAFVIPKGGYDALRAGGLQALRDGIAEVAPFFTERLKDLGDWDQVKLLTVVVDRLERWSRPGMLCIGDAAHAMSPIGGVGINLAVQDAVAAANLLAKPLREGRLTDADLAAVQRRREAPARITQSVQMFIQNKLLASILKSTAPVKPPAVLKLLEVFPSLRGFPARFVGMGVRPEHIGPDLGPSPPAPFAP
jgi:2-polyprenyl-6-methoxyphenol hydroxylase-like FAD-dependent oxidoreductase